MILVENLKKGMNDIVMNENKDCEMIIYLDISSESNFKEILEVSIYHRSDLFHALITKLSLYICILLQLNTIRKQPYP